MSLLTDREVIPVGAAGPLAEPAGIAVAALALAVRAGSSTARSVLLPIESALLAAALLVLVPGAIALITGPAAAFLTMGATATSPFTLAGALLAALAGLVVLLVVRARGAGAGRPRWPWEDRDEP